MNDLSQRSRKPAEPTLGQDQVASWNFRTLIALARSEAIKSNKTANEVAEEIIAPVRERLSKLFPHLLLQPVGAGEDASLTFEFTSTDAPIKFAHLSAGEREVFDLFLDLQMWAYQNANTVFCIDEPELHIHTSVQGLLLTELLALIPQDSQLWIATHSIGMLKTAFDLYSQNNSSVAFLEMQSVKEATLTPTPVNRKLWQNALAVTLHDVAQLVSPDTIVICEGRQRIGKADTEKAEFDAKVHRIIFSDTHPEAAFVASGSCNDIVHDSTKIGAALNELLPGVTIIKIIDSDCDRSPSEALTLQSAGFKILSRREIENYLWCDEILTKLFGPYESELREVLNLKRAKLNKQENDSEDDCDDVKSIRGDLLKTVKSLLALRQSGSSPESFPLNKLAPLVTPETNTYRVLELDIFGATKA